MQDNCRLIFITAHGHVFVSNCFDLINLRVFVNFLVKLGEDCVEQIDDLLRILRIFCAEATEIIDATKHQRHLFESSG